jgi:hypothetical protein
MVTPLPAENIMEAKLGDSYLLGTHPLREVHRVYESIDR